MMAGRFMAAALISLFLLNFYSANGCSRYCRVIQLGALSQPGHYTKCTCEADHDGEYCLPIYDSLEVYLRHTGLIIRSIAVAIACDNITATAGFMDTNSLASTTASTLTTTSATTSAPVATSSVTATTTSKAATRVPSSRYFFHYAHARPKPVTINWPLVFHVEWPFLRFG